MSVFSSVIKNMGSTLGACGDVNRNVLAAPWALAGSEAYGPEAALCLLLSCALWYQACQRADRIRVTVLLES